MKNVFNCSNIDSGERHVIAYFQSTDIFKLRFQTKSGSKKVLAFADKIDSYQKHGKPKYHEHAQFPAIVIFFHNVFLNLNKKGTNPIIRAV